MKVKLTEAQIRRVVAEGARKVIHEAMLNEAVRRAVNETINNFDFGVDEGEEKDTYIRTDNGSELSKKKQKVIQFFHNKGVDVAQYAYELWPDKDKDSCRSYFYKCLNGERDDNGNEYSFSNSEINDLYSMISNATV